MTYALESAKSSSDKFSMVRLEGARFVNHSIESYQVIGPNSIYRVQMPDGLIIKNVTWDNSGLTVFTEKNSLAELNGVNQFFYDYDTNWLYIYKLTGQNNNKPIMVNFYVLLTSNVTRYAKTDLGTGNEHEWQPRLTGEPSFGYSQENNFSGLLSISSSEISANNQDLFFNSLFGVEYSFNNREVKVWKCINSVDNYQVEFIGSIKAAGFDINQCTFSVEDKLTTLDKDFYGNASNSYYNYDTYANLDSVNYKIREDDKYIGVPHLIGKLSSYNLAYFPTGQDLKVLSHIPDKMTKATCVSYNPVPTTSVNRKWSCGVGPSVATNKTWSIDAVSTRIVGTYLSSIIEPTLGVGEVCTDSFAIGDTIRVGTLYALIVDVGDDYIETWPEQLFTTLMTITRVKAPCVVITQGGVDYYPRSIRDYTCSIGTQGDLQITFVNNFEATLSMPNPLNPDDTVVHTRYWNDEATEVTASEIVKKLLTDAGFDCATSFIPPQVIGYEWPDPNLCFMVPDSAGTYPTYRSLLEKCLSSAFQFVYLDNEGKMRLKSFLDPIKPENLISNESGFDHNKELSEETSSDFSARFDFYDSYAGVKAISSVRPDYNNGQKVIGFLAIDRLNNTNKLFEHDNIIDTSTYPQVADFYTALNPIMVCRRVSYSLRAFSPHFSMFIGDDVLLKRSKIVGDKTEFYSRVVSMKKSEIDIDLVLFELQEFPL